MIIGAATNYRCDHCGVVAPGYERALPVGWVAAVWRPGVLTPPTPAAVREPRTETYCSAQCKLDARPRLDATINAWQADWIRRAAGDCE